MATREELLAEAKRRGLQVPQQTSNRDALIAEAQRRGLQIPEAQPEQGMLSKAGNAIKDAWRGNDEFQDAGNIHDYINTMPMGGVFSGDAYKLAASDMFGNTEDVVNRFKQVRPDIPVMQDNNGNPYFEADGKQYYFNKSGADLADGLNLIGEGATYFGGAKAASMVKNAGTLAKMGAVGLAEGGVNMVNQKVAGRDEIDKQEAAIAAAAGGLFEGLTPAVSAIWRKLKNARITDDAAGKALAKEMGANVTDDQAKQLGYMVKNYDPKQVTKETMLQHVELNQTPTLGSLTKNQDILDTEDILRNAGRESTRKKIRMIDDSNELGLQRAMTESQEKMGGSGRDYYNAARDMGDAVIDAEKTAKKGVQQAYDSIDNAYIGTEPFRNAPQRFKKALSDKGTLLAPSTTKRANDVLKDIDKSIEMMGDAKGVSWQAVEAQRKRINSAFAGAEKSDVRALGIIKDEYDAIVDEAFERSLLSGSDEAIKNLTNARGVAADYFKKFNSKEKGGKVIKQWISEGADPEDISNAFLSKSGVVGRNAPKVARAYLDVVGRNTPEHIALKELAIQRFTADKGRAAIRNKLKDAMTNGQTFMNEVFTPKELGFLSRTVQFIDGTTKKGQLGRSSGTTERFFRWMNKSAGQDVSLSNMVNAVKKVIDVATGGEARYLKAPMQQLTVNPATAAGTQGAVNYSNQ
jgi:hypothetical protein